MRFFRIEQKYISSTGSKKPISLAISQKNALSLTEHPEDSGNNYELEITAVARDR
jgi:hypothetical protein